jgi:tRNA(adenine34) deaminase
MNYNEYRWFMDEALKEAETAFQLDEVPVGAVIVDKDGIIISTAHNIKESSHDPCGHAEILAIQKAAKSLSSWRLNEASIFVTLEPCPMCLSAISQARISKLFFGAYDSKGGSLSLGYNLYKDKRLNHRFSVVGGIKHFECSKIISDFFRQKRLQYRDQIK